MFLRFVQKAGFLPIMEPISRPIEKPTGEEHWNHQTDQHQATSHQSLHTLSTTWSPRSFRHLLWRLLWGSALLLFVTFNGCSDTHWSRRPFWTGRCGCLGVDVTLAEDCRGGLGMRESDSIICHGFTRVSREKRWKTCVCLKSCATPCEASIYCICMHLHLQGHSTGIACVSWTEILIRVVLGTLHSASLGFLWQDKQPASWLAQPKVSMQTLHGKFWAWSYGGSGTFGSFEFGWEP